MECTPAYPPLLGDSQGLYKVHLTGNSGVGKSTTGIALAAVLGVPYISLDRLFWQPGWKETPTEEFQAKLRDALNEAQGGWVIDGDYTRRSGDIVNSAATDIIWLDPPLLLYFPRLLLRTFLRLLRIKKPCSPGCPERVTEVFFSKESIIWWCLSQHWINRRRNYAKMQELGIGIGNVEGRQMRRIGGWGSELKIWFRDVQKMIKEKKRIN